VDKSGLLLVVFALATLAVHFLLSPSDHARQIAKRASQVRKQRRPTDVEQEELSVPFSQRVLVPTLDALASVAERMLPGTMLSRLKARLIEAGRPCSVERFIAFKALASVVVFGIYATLVIPTTPAERRPVTILMAIVAALLAFNVPDFWLSNKTDQRRTVIRRHLPDVLDLLSVSVEAGLGFDGAIQKVAEKFKEPVAGEFRTYLAEVRLGKSRAEALRNLRRRTDLPEMQSFVASVVQADQLGVSIAKVLKTQSEALRTRRRQRAEERAMQAPVKMLFPLVFLIFPTLFFVLLGPVAIHWLTTFRNIGTR